MNPSVVPFAVPLALAVALAAQDEADTPNHAVHPPATVTGPAGIVHVEQRGTGEIPAVLIPGAPFGWEAWDGFMTRNAERYTMYAVTLAGYGGTPPPAMPERAVDEPVWTQAVIDGLLELIETKQLDRPLLVAHHLMADYYAMRIAVEQPDAIRGLVVVAGQACQPVGRTPLSGEQRKRVVLGQRAPMYYGMSSSTWCSGTFSASALSTDAKRGRHWYDAQVAVPIPTQLRYYLEYLVDDLTEALPELEVPTLVFEKKVTIDFDRLPASMQKQLIDRFGDKDKAMESVRPGTTWSLWQTKAKDFVQLELVENTGVFVMDDRSELVDAAVADFVAGLEG